MPSSPPRIALLPVLVCALSLVGVTSARAQSLPPGAVFALQSPSGRWLSADANGTLYVSSNATTGAWEQWQFQQQPLNFVTFHGTTPLYAAVSPTDPTPRPLHMAPRLGVSSMSYDYVWDAQGNPYSSSGLPAGGFVGLKLNGNGRVWALADVNGQLVPQLASSTASLPRWKVVPIASPASGRSALKPVVSDSLPEGAVFALQSPSGRWLSADSNGRLYVSTNATTGAWEQWQVQPPTGTFPSAFVTFHGTTPLYRATSSTDPTPRAVHAAPDPAGRPLQVGPAWNALGSGWSSSGPLPLDGWVTLLMQDGRQGWFLADANGQLLPQPESSTPAPQRWKVIAVASPASGRTALRLDPGDTRMSDQPSSIPTRTWFGGMMVNKQATLSVDPRGVLSINIGSERVWRSGPDNEDGPYFAILLSDGNLVIYRGTDPAHHSEPPVWSSGSGGGTGNFTLQLRSNGRIEIMNPDGSVRWSTPLPTITPAVFAHLKQTKVLEYGSRVYFENKTAACPTGTYAVPAGVNLIHILAVGSTGSTPAVSDTSLRGPSGRGGKGMNVDFYYPVRPGQVFYVAGASPRDASKGLTPFGGGGLTPYAFGEGGGASLVSTKPTYKVPNVPHTCNANREDLIVIAGGGGGGGWGAQAYPTSAGGDGGDASFPGEVGGSGTAGGGTGSGGGGGGGSQTSGGVPGSHSGINSDPRDPGGYIRGGDVYSKGVPSIGGAGGAGLWGGGAGGAPNSATPTAGSGGGGGGSSWVSPAALGVEASRNGVAYGTVVIEPVTY